MVSFLLLCNTINYLKIKNDAVISFIIYIASVNTHTYDIQNRVKVSDTFFWVMEITESHWHQLEARLNNLSQFVPRFFLGEAVIRFS